MVFLGVVINMLVVILDLALVDLLASACSLLSASSFHMSLLKFFLVFLLLLQVPILGGTQDRCWC